MFRKLQFSVVNISKSVFQCSELQSIAFNFDKTFVQIYTTEVQWMFFKMLCSVSLYLLCIKHQCDVVDVHKRVIYQYSKHMLLSFHTKTLTQFRKYSTHPGLNNLLTAVHYTVLHICNIKTFKKLLTYPQRLNLFKDTKQVLCSQCNTHHNYFTIKFNFIYIPNSV